MNSDHMVHMANQIALNFQAYPREKAIEGVRNHLQMFWEKRMKQQLRAYVTSGGAGLHEYVVEAEKLLK